MCPCPEFFAVTVTPCFFLSSCCSSFLQTFFHLCFLCSLDSSFLRIFFLFYFSSSPSFISGFSLLLFLFSLHFLLFQLSFRSSIFLPPQLLPFLISFLPFYLFPHRLLSLLVSLLSSAMLRASPAEETPSKSFLLFFFPPLLEVPWSPPTHPSSKVSSIPSTVTIWFRTA